MSFDPAALAAAVIGPVTGVEAVNGFVGNQIFRLHTASGTYYLKSGDRIPPEAEACALARSVDVPSPRVVAVEVGPPPYLVSAELPGAPSTDSSVLVEAGRCVRRLHTIRGSSVADSADEGVADPAAWRATLTEAVDKVDRLGGILPEHLMRQLRVVLPPFIESVADVEPVLLHGDLHPRHLYAVRGRLSGILDWGDAAYGDPVFDLARLSMAGVGPTAAFLSGYGPVDASERTLSCYRVVWSLMAMQAERAAGGDWFRVHVDTIERELVS